jgi:hypothetical protein
LPHPLGRRRGLPATDRVDRDDKIFVGVEGLARSDRRIENMAIAERAGD